MFPPQERRNERWRGVIIRKVLQRLLTAYLLWGLCLATRRERSRLVAEYLQHSAVSAQPLLKTYRSDKRSERLHLALVSLRTREKQKKWLMGKLSPRWGKLLWRPHAFVLGHQRSKENIRLYSWHELLVYDICMTITWIQEYYKDTSVDRKFCEYFGNSFHRFQWLMQIKIL